MAESDAYTDVVELCALLQCLGFSVKSLDTQDGNVSQEGGSRTVTINCQASGLHVILESPNLTCTCPAPASQQNSGFWQVSGITGGKQSNKEYGSVLLRSLPKEQRERLTRELQNIVRCIKEHNESDVERPRDNKSASMLDLQTPEKRDFGIKSLAVETPTRYRSLDALTAAHTADPNQLPAPGPLQKQLAPDAADADNKLQKCVRQSTYTLSPTSESSRRRNKTSSPIQMPQHSTLESLIAAEKVAHNLRQTAEELKNKISNVIKEITEEGRHDSSMSSLALDVSKISVLKGPESSKLQFASSPNLSGMGVQDDFVKKLKRTEFASTSNLASSKHLTKEAKTSKLRRLSPNFLKLKGSSSASKTDKDKTQDSKSSKLNNLLKSRLITPVRATKSNTEASPNLSATKKKFSHVKSTIPRPASRKE